MFWVRSVGSQTILQSYTILYTIIPFLGSLYDPKRFCNVPSVKKKKKKGNDQIILVPTCSPPNPTPHHSFSPTSLLSFGWLSLFFISFSFFSLYLNTHTHTHFHTYPSASTPKHTISPSFFRQDHRKNT